MLFQHFAYALVSNTQFWYNIQASRKRYDGYKRRNCHSTMYDYDV